MLRHRAWGNIRSRPQGLPSNSSCCWSGAKIPANRQAPGSRGATKAPKCSESVERAGRNRRPQSAGVLSTHGDPIPEVGGMYQDSECPGLARHSCLHTGTTPRRPLPTRRAQGHSHQVAAAPGAGLSGPNMQWLRHCCVPKEVFQATAVSPVTYSHA